MIYGISERVVIDGDIDWWCRVGWVRVLHASDQIRHFKFKFKVSEIKCAM
jgi:hypothetical protein